MKFKADNPQIFHRYPEKVREECQSYRPTIPDKPTEKPTKAEVEKCTKSLVEKCARTELEISSDESTQTLTIQVLPQEEQIVETVEPTVKRQPSTRSIVMF